jgi:rubrerythrin
MSMIDDAIALYERRSAEDFGCCVEAVHADLISTGKALSKSARQNKQVAEWLKELKQLREERPHGKWERHYSRPGVYADLFWHCSNCGYKCKEDYANKYYKFCPNCGSYNEEVEND